MAGPNERLEKFLAQHVIADGRCACGWDISSYDIEPYEWEDAIAPARRRAWIAHVTGVWRDAHPLGKIQQAAARDPNGDEVLFDMEPGHDTLREAPHTGRTYHGEYRYADYEPPHRDDSDISQRITCEEAKCRDPHCLGGHFRIALSFPASCAGCGRSFEDGEERVGVAMQNPGGRPIETGTALASAAAYHTECQPSDDELRARAEELWPRTEPVAPEPEMRQAMACLSCGLAGATPEAHYPQEPGLWDRPCPQCGEYQVWVTEA